MRVAALGAGRVGRTMVRMLARNLYAEPGITPPELVGRDPACFEFVMKELDGKGVRFPHTIEEMS